MKDVNFDLSSGTNLRQADQQLKDSSLDKKVDVLISIMVDLVEKNPQMFEDMKKEITGDISEKISKQIKDTKDSLGKKCSTVAHDLGDIRKEVNEIRH